MSEKTTEKLVNTQSRWRSWPMWLSVIGALWVILSAFGVTKQWGIEESAWKSVVDAIGSILIGFGIVNNPTSADTM